MNKYLLSLSASALLCFSFATHADTASELFAKFKDAETHTVTFTKGTTDALKAKNLEVTTSPNFFKVKSETSEDPANENDDQTGDDSDEDGYASLIDPIFYASTDKNTLYVLVKEGTPGYPNYLKVEMRDFDGAKNARASFVTNVSTQALNFKESSEKEVNITFSLMGLLLELSGSSSDLTLDKVEQAKKVEAFKKSLTSLMIKTNFI